MTAPLPDVPSGFSSLELGSRALQHLHETGFHERNLARLTRGFTIDVSDPRVRDSVLPAADPNTPLGALLRLFSIGADVTLSQAEAALGSVDVSDWERAGFLTVDSRESVRALVTLSSFGGFTVASDRHPMETGDASSVMNVSLSTLSLARLMIPGPPVARAADIGCGSGLLALLLSRGAAEVVATDAEPRALAFTALNARWNGVSSIRCVEGDGITPLVGTRFDRVLSNPPLVLGPAGGFRYARGGDSFVESLVRGLPRILADEGVAQLLAHWAFDPEKPAAILEWFDRAEADRGPDDLEVDAQVWCSRTMPIEAYVQQWIATDPDPRESAPKWLAHFQEKGISQIAEGLLNLRATAAAGPKLRSLDPAPPRMDGETPRELLIGFRRQEYLRRHAGEALRRAVVHPHPGIQIVQETEARTDGWASPTLRLARAIPIARSRPIEGPILSLVTRCDRSTSLGSIIDGIIEGGNDAERAQLLEVARELIALGFLDGPDFEEK